MIDTNINQVGENKHVGGQQPLVGDSLKLWNHFASTGVFEARPELAPGFAHLNDIVDENEIKVTAHNINKLLLGEGDDFKKLSKKDKNLLSNLDDKEALGKYVTSKYTDFLELQIIEQFHKAHGIS